MRRLRRRAVAAAAVTGTGLLGASLASPPGSPRFYVLTAATAATWAGGGLLAGPVQWGRPGRGVLAPAALGVLAFLPFYGVAMVGRHLPPLRRMLTSVLAYANRGGDRAVLATTLVNGVAEELFFRQAVYVAVGDRMPVVASTGTYVLVTAATRNPALVAAAAVMGVVFGLQRRATGGVGAPMVTHLVWSTLMLRVLPPLFTAAGR
ncbi:CPBP family glutamic-type intramembrane protease [Actinophytocola sediminis]